MAARVPLPILPASFKKKKKKEEEEVNAVELEDITERKQEEEEEIEEELREHGDGDDNAGNSPTNQGNRVEEEEDDDDESLTLDEHAEIVMAILKPVALTMIVVIVIEIISGVIVIARLIFGSLRAFVVCLRWHCFVYLFVFSFDFFESKTLICFHFK